MLFFSFLFACDTDPSNTDECVSVERTTMEETQVLDAVDGNLDFAFAMYGQKHSEKI